MEHGRGLGPCPVALPSRPTHTHTNLDVCSELLLFARGQAVPVLQQVLLPRPFTKALQLLFCSHPCGQCAAKGAAEIVIWVVRGQTQTRSEHSGRNYTPYNFIFVVIGFGQGQWRRMGQQCPGKTQGGASKTQGLLARFPSSKLVQRVATEVFHSAT